MWVTCLCFRRRSLDTFCFWIWQTITVGRTGANTELEYMSRFTKRPIYQTNFGNCFCVLPLCSNWRKWCTLKHVEILTSMLTKHLAQCVLKPWTTLWQFSQDCNRSLRWSLIYILLKHCPHVICTKLQFLFTTRLNSYMDEKRHRLPMTHLGGNTI